MTLICNRLLIITCSKSTEKTSDFFSKLWADWCLQSSFMITSALDSCNPFQPSVAFHIETNHLICTLNQMNGFYMKFNTELKWAERIRHFISECLRNVMKASSRPYSCWKSWENCGKNLEATLFCFTWGLGKTLLMDTFRSNRSQMFFKMDVV